MSEQFYLTLTSTIAQGQSESEGNEEELKFPKNPGQDYHNQKE